MIFALVCLAKLRYLFEFFFVFYLQVYSYIFSNNVLERHSSTERITSNLVKAVGVKHDTFQEVVIVQVRDCTLEHIKREIQLLQIVEACENVVLYFTVKIVVVEVEVFERCQRRQ